jgi:hypothetical protein
MKIDVIHQRASMGNDIQVSVDADGGSGIVSIEVVLDGHSLVEETLSTANDAWRKTMPGAGNAGPGMDHTLVVTAGSEDGKTHVRTEEWTDPS